MRRYIARFINSIKEPIFITLLGIVSVLAFIPILTYAFFATSLGSKEAIMNRNNTGLVILDRNNKPFFRFYDAKVPILIPLLKIPDQLQQAVVAAEDREFYQHPGFSIKGIFGAIMADIKHGSLSYGGSTITQQLVKTSLLSSKRSFLRKYQELILAQELERRYSKNEILEMYLNSVYFGEGAFGVEEAAKTYFNKSVTDLNLAEDTVLAGVINSPSKLSPLRGNLEQSKARSAYVLDEMIQMKYINSSQAEIAKQTLLVLNEHPEPFPYKAPHFALMVRDQLIEKYGEEKVTRSGFRVKTTLDLDWQEYAEKVVAEQVASLKSSNVSNGGAVVEDPKTGEIKALVGSTDWNDDKFGKLNITEALRQPGSSFKPIVYITGFEKQIITPGTVLRDDPITFKGRQGSPPYKPNNYDLKFRGPVTVRRGLSNSLNIPAVEVLEQVGIPSAVEMAKRLGITTLGDPEQYGLSMVLGAAETKLIEMTNVYATFANQGLKNDSTLILEITNKENIKEFEYKPRQEQVLDPEYPFLISSILSDNQTRAESFGNVLNISRPAAVKTGTSENYKDSLTIGYTPSLAIGVWVGNNFGEQMSQVAGSIGAAPIWRQLMEKFLEGTPVEQFIPPSNIAMVMVCKNNGLVAREATSSAIKEYFVKGTEPSKFCGSGGYNYLPNSSPNPYSPMPIPSILTPENPPAPSLSPTPSVTQTSTPSPTPSVSPSPTPPPSASPSLPPGQEKKQ